MLDIQGIKSAAPLQTSAKAATQIPPHRSNPSTVLPRRSRRCLKIYTMSLSYLGTTERPAREITTKTPPDTRPTLNDTGLCVSLL